MSGTAAPTRVLVHGAPETKTIWTPLLEELSALGIDNVVTLSPPAFGAPVPEGFEATVDGYRNWLVEQLEKFDEPVDLVGHDFGGIHVAGVAMHRPDLIRSWVSDAIGTLEPDYVWHETAQVWQTPEGEAFIDEMFSGDAEARAQRMVRWGVPEPIAKLLGDGLDDHMARTLLPLYRSSAQPAMAEHGKALHQASARPGLFIISLDDHVIGTLEQRRRAGQRAGAKTEELEGFGHWWMLQDPKRSALILRDFWASVPPKN
ncbi:alpha/beta fold hydrolase [Streptomyces sp. SudanB66_2053]|uniref:alpha/beta fold hydrolase n=1 Tax=Streptomyces sp. SudanB66_2053 TaxID=3035277 RepID=UPI003F57BFC1